MGECFFCGEPVEEDCFCGGCDTFVCDDCAWIDPIGVHHVSAHQSNPNEESEDEEA